MKILYVIESLGKGGAEQMLATVAPELVRRGSEVWVAVMKAPFDLKPVLEESGVKVQILPRRCKWNLLGRMFDLSRFSKRCEADIIHAHLYFPAICTALVKILRRNSVKTAVTFHNLAYQPGVNPEGLSLWLRKRLAKFLYPSGFDEKLAVSHAVKNHYVESLGLKGVRIIYNAVDLTKVDRFYESWQSPNKSVTKIVLPGRLVHEKGHLQLLDALVEIRKQALDFDCVFVGGGPLHDTLKSQIELKNLSQFVSISGRVNHSEMLKQLASADIVVVPSLFEGFGLTAIESMALGRPVVASNVGGLAEIIDHELTGLLATPESPIEFCNAITILVKDFALRKKLGEAGRNHVMRNYSLEIMVSRLINVYSACLRELN